MDADSVRPHLNTKSAPQQSNNQPHHSSNASTAKAGALMPCHLGHGITLVGPGQQPQHAGASTGRLWAAELQCKVICRTCVDQRPEAADELSSADSTRV